MWRLFSSLVLLAGCQGDSAPPPPVALEAVLAPEPGTLRLMGSGAMTPLARRWADAWGRRSPRIVVEPSVGSGGGARAAADGAVDLGMISRPLDEQERRLGLLSIPLARDVVVIAAHPSVSVDGLSGAELAALYAGRSHQFSDGSRATLLIRDANESANLALERVFPQLTPLRKEAYRTGRLRVLYHDDAMEQALLLTPGSLGVVSLSSLLAEALPLKVLAIDGVRPTIDDRRWLATRDLALVVRPDRRPLVEEFLAFVRSAEGRRLTRECGYLPQESP